MRRLLLAAAFAAAVGCGKKPAPAPIDDPAPAPPAAAEPERDRLLTTFKTKRGDPQRKAGDDLAALAESDPAVVDGLVELLRDRTTNGAGTTHPQRVGSTREAAALLLVRCGPKGEAALKDRGLAFLREGLIDKDAAVREHTAYTLGLLGAAAKPVAPSLQRLCSDPDAKVAAVAFDAVANVGVADVAAFVPLLTSENETTKRRAAEIVGVLPEVPGDAVPTLARALGDTDPYIRAAAASGIAAANGKGVTAKTAEAVGAAIQTAFPQKADLESAFRLDAPEFALWPALRSCGKHAVKPAADLLAHGNPIVRQLAARILGEIGPDAKEAAEALRRALTDEFNNVALEAGGALVRVGGGADEVDPLIRAGLASLNRGVAAEAIGAVARMGPAGAKHHAEVLGKLDSPLPDARFAALGFVRTLPPAERVKHLTAIGKALGDEQPLIRGRAAWLLEDLGPAAAPAAGAARDALSKEAEPGVQEQLVNTLAAMGPGAKGAVGALLPLIADRAAGSAFREKVILTAVALDPASPEVAGAVKRATDSKDVVVRCAAARALGTLNPFPPDAAATLAKMARSDAEAVGRVAALRGLVAAGPRAKAVRADVAHVAEKGMPGTDVWAKVALAALDGDVTKAAGTIRESLGSRGVAARAAAAEALLLVGPSASDVPALVRVLRDPTPAGKAAAAAALGRLGPAAKEAVPKLVPLITDGESEVRVAAADAAAAIGLPAAAPAVPRLRTALTDFPNDPPTVAAALRALSRLGAEVEAPRSR